jgi:glycosyltransferase involved in cell wall biosynthesis
MYVSVIIATYNQPAWLEKVLWGYGAQTYEDFELVIADDGSGPHSAAVIDAAAREGRRRIVHVRHDDDGFRKCEILNHAIVASRGEYVIVSDGDCIPRADFVATHVSLARVGRFVSGGYLKLPRELSERIGRDDVLSGRVADRGWLAAQGWRAGRRALRLLPSRAAAALLDRMTPTRASWNGHNASTWRTALLDVNGFDAEMKYGGQDRALGERLERAGYRGIQARFRTPVLHLDHGRPYMNEQAMRHNREVRARIRRLRETRARSGIAERNVADVVVRVAGRPLDASRYGTD